jgi:cytochrome c peroxidase
MNNLVRPLLLSLAVVAACRRSSAPATELPKTPLGLPEHVDPKDNPTTLPKVTLGRFLFFDPRMSTTDFMSCADCHREEHGWAGHESKSINAMGKRTRRKALSAANTAYPTSYTWNGRADTLENVITIGWSQLGMTDEDAIAKKLDAIPDYHALFMNAFGAPPTGLRIRQALGAYLRAVKIGDSPYDRFMAGDASALGEQAKRGLSTFNTLGCPSCHAPPLFSDWKFHNAGVGAQDKDDQGRFEFTKVEEDRKRYRTPSLRNVANTGPWFHDGSAASLDDAITWMASGGVATPGLDPLFKPRTPAPGEIADLRAFLESLSGKPTFEVPKMLPGGRPRT